MTGGLVQEMVAPGVETIVGVVHHPLFGPLVMFGMGGVDTELRHDRSFRILPLTDVDAAELVRSLRAAPLLFGYRGSQPVALTELEDLLQRVARLAGDVPALAELDINPLIASPSGAIAVDVRARVAPVSPGPPPDCARRLSARWWRRPFAGAQSAQDRAGGISSRSSNGIGRLQEEQSPKPLPSMRASASAIASMASRAQNISSAAIARMSPVVSSGQSAMTMASCRSNSVYSSAIAAKSNLRTSSTWTSERCRWRTPRSSNRALTAIPFRAGHARRGPVRRRCLFSQSATDSIIRPDARWRSSRRRHRFRSFLSVDHSGGDAPRCDPRPDVDLSYFSSVC